MTRSISILVIALFAAVPGTASAQASEGVTVIYGNDKCPTNEKGEEITVCARQPESERFRIPKDLRSGGKYADRESWAVTSHDLLNAGASGPGSCTNSGLGAWTGCSTQDYSSWKAQKRLEKSQEQAATDISHHEKPSVTLDPSQ
ncbi:MAG: hypothetical protein KGL21_01765 [Alphaproteobacteria bacterium]|nr:hypothetical protein [Alphaproteobacteria bacterium]